MITITKTYHLPKSFNIGGHLKKKMGFLWTPYQEKKILIVRMEEKVLQGFLQLVDKCMSKLPYSYSVLTVKILKPTR